MFTISYDPVEVLRDFARDRGITFHMLSDEGSEVIRRLGMLNTQIGEQQAYYGFGVTERHRGLPHPGTFILDERGVVSDKHFDQSYRDRPSGEFLLSQTDADSASASYEARAPGRLVDIRARVSQSTYRPMQRTILRVSVTLAPDVHVYTDPVPDGYVPISFDLKGTQDIQTWTPEVPTGSSFTIEGLDEQFYVLEGSFDVAVPFKVSGSKHLLDGRARDEPLDSDAVILTLTVEYQACTRTECFAPQRRLLSVPLVEEPLES